MDNSSGTEGIGAVGFLASKRYCLFTSFDNKTLIIDSGASDHITHDLYLLHDVKVVQSTCYITLPNVRQAQIRHTGSVFLASGLILHNVIHVLEF